MDWESVRKHYPGAIKDGRVYLATGGVGLVSTDALEVCQQTASDIALHGTINVFDKYFPEVNKVREKMAAFIGANVEEVALVHSTSEALNLAAWLLRKRSDEFVCLRDEYPSVPLAFINQGKTVRFVAEHEIMEAGGVVERALVNAFDNHPSAKLLVCSHVSFITGRRLDLDFLGRFCEERGADLVVDATQSVGAIQLDVQKTNVSCVCGDSYKWLGAGPGIAYFYARHDLLRADPNAPFAGWYSQQKVNDDRPNDRVMFWEDARRFSPGCPCFPMVSALGAALDLQRRIGPQRIEERVLELTRELRSLLHARGFEVISPESSGTFQALSGNTLVSVADPTATQAALFEHHGVYVFCEPAKGAFPKPSGLRVSPHIYNDIGDLKRFADALAAVQPALSRRMALSTLDDAFLEGEQADDDWIEVTVEEMLHARSALQRADIV